MRGKFVELADMVNYNDGSGGAEDRGPLLSGSSSSDGADGASGQAKPAILRVMRCAVTSVAAFVVLSIIATYIVADADGQYLILDREDTKQTRANKAIHVFIAAAIYLVLGVYNCYVWKKTDSQYTNDPDYYPLS